MKLQWHSIVGVMLLICTAIVFFINLPNVKRQKNEPSAISGQISALVGQSNVLQPNGQSPLDEEEISVNGSNGYHVHATIGEAVSEAIESCVDSILGEKTTAAHIILDSYESSEQEIIVYGFAGFGRYGYENSVFRKITGERGIPFEIILSKESNGGYFPTSLQMPELYRWNEFITDCFPENLHGEDYLLYEEILKNQEDAQAKAYLQSIGKESDLWDGTLEKEAIPIHPDAFAKLAAFITSDNAYEWYPYWQGARERTDGDQRWVYQTDCLEEMDGRYLIRLTLVDEGNTIWQEIQFLAEGGQLTMIKFENKQNIE